MEENINKLSAFTVVLNFICMCVQGIYLSGKELRKLILPKSAPFEEKLRIHKEVLCARHIPVFHEWFLRTFPDPTSWYDPPHNSFCNYFTCLRSTVSLATSLVDIENIRDAVSTLDFKFLGGCKFDILKLYSGSGLNSGIKLTVCIYTTYCVCLQVQQSLCVLSLHCCDVHGRLHPGSGRPPRRKHPL